MKIILGEAASTGRAEAEPGGGVSAALDLGDEACAVMDGGSGVSGAAARWTTSDATGREMLSTEMGTAIAAGKAGEAAGAGG